MPSEHHFLRRPYLYCARFTGVLTLSDLLEGVDLCRRSEHFHSSMPQIIDLSLVGEIDLDFEALRSFLATLRRDYARNETNVDMLIFVGPDHDFAYARQFQMLATPLETLRVRVFTELNECLAALDLSYPSIDALLRDALPATTAVSIT